MSTRMLVAECFDGNHAACKGYNGPADAPNFRCDCDCHQTVSEDKDKALDDLVEGLFTNGFGATADRLVLMKDSALLGGDLGGWARGPVRDRIKEYAATVRREARAEAFKDAIAVVGATENTPRNAGWKAATITALERAAESGEGGNDEGMP